MDLSAREQHWTQPDVGRARRLLSLLTPESIQRGRTRDLTLAPAAVPSMAARRYRRLYRWMRLTDVAGVALAVSLGNALTPATAGGRFDLFLHVAIVAAVVLALYAALKLYSVHQIAPAEEFRRLLLGTPAALLVVFVLPTWAGPMPRSWLLVTMAFSTVFSLASRRLWHYWIFLGRQRGAYVFRTLIVGTNDEATRLRDVLRSGLQGFQPVGFVHSEGGSGDCFVCRPSKNGHGGREAVLPMTGEIDDLRSAIRDAGAECVFVAASSVHADEMAQVSRIARQEGVELRVTSCLPEILASRLSLQPLGGVMALSLKPVRLTGTQAIAKRAFDLVASAFGLVLSLPLWGAIALAVKLSSSGPVLFRQERVGRGGRPFEVLKFRTMVQGADSMLEELRGLNEADGPLFKLRSDPRVTPVGRLLRKWSLDELPQLVNVLKGQMSLVGPRPALPSEVDQYDEWHRNRLEVAPGITGLWQVKGRSDAGFDEYVRLDLFYIENWSIAYDLYILASTVKSVLARDGAY